MTIRITKQSDDAAIYAHSFSAMALVEQAMESVGVLQDRKSGITSVRGSSRHQSFWGKDGIYSQRISGLLK